MRTSINNMVNRMTAVLSKNNASIFLFGSVALNDFKLGWSDIDILCLTEKVISEEQAEILVELRQALSAEHPDNPYFLLFEGGILSLNAFVKQTADKVVYWGTGNQRITDTYRLDPFSMIELKNSGRLLYGDDIRDKLAYPTEYEIKGAIIHHYKTIRKYAKVTGRSIKSAGWLLDIARCLYTLKAGKIIAKTAAGEWAIKEKLVPDIPIMERALEIRNKPDLFKTDEETLTWLAGLGPYIQAFADVLERYLL